MEMVLESSQPNRRHTTMADVAAQTGVSRQLVGLVFKNSPKVNAGTAEKIRRVAAELGYSPNFAAQALRGDGTRYIGVVYHTFHSSTEKFLPGFYKYAAARGYKIVLSAISHERSEILALEDVRGHRCDGLIVIASGMPISQLKELAKKTPLVIVSRRVSGVRCGVVSSKGEAGVFDAVEHLISLGHKSIAYIQAKDMLDTEYRLEGYRTAMDKAKLKHVVIPVPGTYLFEGIGAEGAEKILALTNRPTAVVCSNDQVALGALHVLLKAGIRVPEDISLVGYDDIVASWSFLDLTSVHQDHDEMAKVAIDDVADRIEGKKFLPELYLTSSKLVVRSSTTSPQT